jgi:hypothetical protein
MDYFDGVENYERVESIARCICGSEIGKMVKDGYVVQKETDCYRLCFYSRGASRDLMCGFYSSLHTLDLASL